MAPDDARARVLALLERHGWNATSFQVLEPGFRYWFDGADDDACVGYVDTGRAWVAAGPPIAAGDRLGEVAHRFTAAVRSVGLYDFDGLRAFKAKFRPRSWDPIFLTYAPGRSGVVAITDTLRAFARGGLLRFGLETFLRGPSCWRWRSWPGD